MKTVSILRNTQNCENDSININDLGNIDKHVMLYAGEYDQLNLHLTSHEHTEKVITVLKNYPKMLTLNVVAVDPNVDRELFNQFAPYLSMKEAARVYKMLR